MFILINVFLPLSLTPGCKNLQDAPQVQCPLEKKRQRGF